MAHFKVISSGLSHPHYEFIIQLLNGTIDTGQAFSIYDTSHRFDFKVDKVQKVDAGLRILCSADFLKAAHPKEKWPDIFDGKEVDTNDPTVAQRFAYRWATRAKKPWWKFW